MKMPFSSPRFLFQPTTFGLVVTVLLVSLHGKALAFYPTDEDMRFLPPYCKARLRSDQVPASEVEKWKNFLGRETWSSFHHYCQGVNYVIRGEREIDQRKKSSYYQDGIKNLVFHLKTYGPKFPLRSQTYSLLGTAYLGLGNVAAAIDAYNTSIEANKKNIRSYRALADIYLDSGDLDSASSIVDKGLAISPKSKSLLRRKKLIQSKMGK